MQVVDGWLDNAREQRALSPLCRTLRKLRGGGGRGGGGEMEVREEEEEETDGGGAYFNRRRNAGCSQVQHLLRQAQHVHSVLWHSQIFNIKK